MLFTNPRSISKTQSATMPFHIGMARSRFQQVHPLLPQQPLEQQPPQNMLMPTPTLSREERPVKKPMKWGEPTWFLFHTLAEKVKDESFNLIRKELLDVIYTICANLPCPTCASHATKHMNGINYSTIQTKQQLKDMLFSFHNTVNSKKQYPLFDYANLDAKYSAANTIAIIQNFMVYFQDKHASIHMIANDLHRRRIANILKAWFNENIVHFNL